MNKLISSSGNDLVKWLTGLRLRKNRYRYRQFLVEGTKLLDTATGSGISPRLLVVREDFRAQAESRYKDIVRRCETVFVSQRVMDKISVSPSSPPVAAVFDVDAVVNPAGRQYGDGRSGLVLILNRIQDPGNLGSIIRSAVALGASEVVCDRHCVDLLNEKVIRASMGGVFRLAVREVVDILTVIDDFYAQGTEVVVADICRQACPVWQYRFGCRKTAVVLGNEGQGLSQDIVDLGLKPLIVPIVDGFDSLNVAVTAAIILYEYRRQRMSACG
ncbi:MAG: RNA methyltransferase [Negativicutes bacterium]|nr:RNA methyltransferase [Negativicutes bacterium]